MSRWRLTLTTLVPLKLPYCVLSLSVVPSSDPLATSIWCQCVPLKSVISWWYSAQCVMVQFALCLVPTRVTHILLYLKVSVSYLLF